MKNKILLVIIIFSINSYSQKEKLPNTQLSDFLSKSYYSVNLGGIFYPFSNDNLKKEFATETFSKNAFSGRIIFLGYKIKPNLAIQFGVIRPASWFKYDNINNIGYDRSVWINAWSLSLKKNLYLSNKLSFYVEAGPVNVSRIGFEINNEEIYSSTRFFSLLYGVGLNYKFSKKWRLALNSTFIPKSDKENQPAISQFSLGFEYHLQKKSDDEAIEIAKKQEHYFPKSILQIGYGTNKIGYGVNRFLSMNTTIGNFESFGIPVFWLGKLKTTNSFSVTYQKTAYRSKKHFSLDWGVSATAFQTEASNDAIYAFSIFPVLRFYLLRKKNFDMYTNYSIIGPTYLTKSNIDGINTGPKITYQDKIGLGFFLGKQRKYNFEMRIMHYSNGNIFTNNAGIAVPIQFTFGKTF
ncbi:acyloxyacyl hydrolase [Polaribacter sp. WD7]|uniref:acyloxyacyl hydrolase n=1 Tax=Polaribacter sp. WD7 TaxID=2269061 RepID=UPI000DF2628D|nr:acyloxyacyl hydrolase [Polaribacter sp. WD7]RCS27860.1 acyloxyacyl hydrolase [Polaribacter sp. WD7]